MKYGMPTLVECKGINECVDVARELGIDFIEINMSFPEYLPSALDAQELREVTRKWGIGYTIHADEMLNPFDFNKKVSDVYFDVMRDTIRFAIDIGATVINMHLLKGVYVTTPGKVLLLTDVYREEYLGRVCDFIKMCEEEIGDSELKVAIENVDSNPFTDAQRAALKYFLESPVFALTLDTGHEHCLSGADRDIYLSNPDKVMHMHLHDAKGKSAHLPLGSGDVTVIEKMKENRGNTCLIEVKTVTGLRESLGYLKNVKEGKER